MIIRALRADDVDAVVEFSVRAWRPVFESFMRVMGPDIFPRIYPDWQAAQAKAVADACRNEAHQAWVAEAGDGRAAAGSAGRPVGFAVVAIHDSPRSGEVSMIAVDPGYQRQGIGQALLAFAVDQITRLGVPLAQIGTGGDPGHASARRLYEKAGFTPFPQVLYLKALPGTPGAGRGAPTPGANQSRS